MDTGGDLKTTQRRYRGGDLRTTNRQHGGNHIRSLSRLFWAWAHHQRKLKRL